MPNPHFVSRTGAFFGTLGVATKALANNGLAAGFVYTAASVAVAPIIVTGIVSAHNAELQREADDRAQFASAGSPRPVRQASRDDDRPLTATPPPLDLAGRLPSLLLSRTSFLVRYEGEPTAAAFVRVHLDDLIAEGRRTEDDLVDAQGELAHQARRLKSLDQRLIALRTSVSSADGLR